MRKIFLTHLIFIHFFLFSGCNSDKSVVVQIGDTSITAGELKVKLKKTYVKKPLNELSLENKQKILDQMIEVRKKLLWALDKSWDQDQEFLGDFKRYKNRVLAMELYSQLVTDVLLPESLLKKYYQWQNTKIKAIALVVGSLDSRRFKKKRTIEEAEKLAKHHRDVLVESVNPDKYAAKFTDDNSKSYKVDSYKFGQFSIEVDSAVARTPVSQVAGPFNLGNEFIMFKILEREKRAIKRPFEEAKSQLVRLLKPKLRNKERQLFQKISDEMKAKYQVEIFDDNIERFSQALADWIKNPENDYEDFTDEQLNILLGQIMGTPFLVSDFIDLFGKRLRSDYHRFKSSQTLKENYVFNQLNMNAWAMEAVEMGLDKDTKIGEKLEQYRQNRLAQMVEQREIGDKVIVTEEDIEKYYQNNIDIYTVPKTIKTWRIPLKDPASAKEVLKKAKSGVDFKELYNKFSSGKKGRENRYNLGYLSIGHQYFPEMAKKAHQAGPNKIFGPVVKDSLFYILKTGEMKPERVKPLKQVKHVIRSKIFSENKAQIRAKIIEQINQKYTHKIDEAVLRKIN